MSQARLQFLKRKLLQTYRLGALPLKIKGESFQLYVVEDFDRLLDELIAKEEGAEAVQDERIPYWADLWHSAIGLAEYVLRDRRVGEGTRVLELGCGLGLSGVAAGKKGAEVLLTDYLVDALELAELNWLENVGTPAQVQCLDWRVIPDALRPEVVLAADVAYETRSFSPLIAAFHRFTQQGARILLSEPGRYFSQPFLSQLEAAFTVKATSVPVRYRNLLQQVGVYELTKV